MKTKLAQLTARRSNGQEYPVEIVAGVNGLHGEIDGKYLPLDTINGKPVVRLTAKTAKEILGIEAKDGGAIILTKDWKPIRDAYEKEQKEIAMNANIVGFVRTLGCDAADRMYFVYDFPEGMAWNAKSPRISQDEKLASVLTWQEVSEIAERIGAKKLEADGMSYGGYEFDASNVGELIAAATAKLEAKQAASDMKKAEARKIRDEKFAEAKRTGNGVILESYPVECNDPNEECSCDIITVYAMPDGSTKSNRSHTY